MDLYHKFLLLAKGILTGVGELRPMNWVLVKDITFFGFNLKRLLCCKIRPLSALSQQWNTFYPSALNFHDLAVNKYNISLLNLYGQHSFNSLE